MKNLIQYFKLWEKKRSELRIDADANADWMEMSALLDKYMPGNNNSGGGFKRGGISLLSIILLIFSIGAAVYFTVKVVQTKQKADYTKNEQRNKNHGFGTGNDSSARSENPQPGMDSANGISQHSD